MLLEKDAGSTQDIEAVNFELQRKSGLMRGEMPMLKTTVPTSLLVLAKSVHEVTFKNKTLTGQLMNLQEMVTNDQAAGKVVENDMAQVERTTVASAELDRKFTKSNTLLATVRAELASLKKELSRLSKVKVSDKAILKDLEESQQRLRRSNGRLTGSLGAETLVRLVIAKSVHSIDKVFKQSGP